MSVVKPCAINYFSGEILINSLVYPDVSMQHLQYEVFVAWRERTWRELGGKCDVSLAETPQGGAVEVRRSQRHHHRVLSSG